MNVLFLSYSYLPNVGGVERSVFNLASRLIAGGHRVMVVTHSPSTFLFSFHRNPGPPVLHLHVPVQCSFGWIARLKTLFRNVLNSVILVAVCIGCRIQIVHCHFLANDSLYAGRLSRLLGIPNIVTLRGGETAEWVIGKPRRKAYLTRILKAADHITGVAQAILVEAMDYLPELLKKGSMIPNPVDPGCLEEMANLAEGSDGPGDYVLFVGRLEYQKDVECLVDAYHCILGEDRSFGPNLLIVGAGARGDDLKHRSVAGPARDRILFLGCRSYPETLRLIRGALMLVLPSRWEGCPNVVLEAMALHAPVVVSDIPALLEVVRHGVNGSIFRLGEPLDLKQRIVDLAGDPEKRCAYTARAAQYIQHRHRFETIVSQYGRLYSELLQRRHRRITGRVAQP